MLGTLIPNLVSSRDRRERKKKIWKPVPNKTLTLKGAIPELKDNYFFMLEDNSKCMQDKFRYPWKAIGIYMSRKVEYSQDLALLFDKFEVPRVYLPEEPRSNQ